MVASTASDAMLRDAVRNIASETHGFGNVISRREAAEIIGRVLTLFPVAAAALCGSFAREEQGPDSDIDLLVSFEPGSCLADSEATREALEYATGRDVDLITTLDGQTKAFRDSVLRDGVRIYG